MGDKKQHDVQTVMVAAGAIAREIALAADMNCTQMTMKDIIAYLVRVSDDEELATRMMRYQLSEANDG